MPFQPSTNVFVPEVASAYTPAAKQAVALTHDTPASSVRLEPAGLGTETIDQLVPFHRSTTRLIELAVDSPTAKQLVVLVHETPPKPVEVAPEGFGLVTIDQLVPFHRSTRVFVDVVLVEYEPTAKQLVVLTHETASSPAVAPEGVGLLTIDQLVPFHRSTKVYEGWVPAVLPTAKQLVALTQEMPLNSVPVAPEGFGLGRIDQLVPFHRSTNDRFVALVSKLPTAKQVVLVGHDTACKPPVGGPSGLGLGETDHTGAAPAGFSVATHALVTSAAAISTRTRGRVLRHQCRCRDPRLRWSPCMRSSVLVTVCRKDRCNKEPS